MNCSIHLNSVMLSSKNAYGITLAAALIYCLYLITCNQMTCVKTVHIHVGNFILFRSSATVL